jgi:hypothetical protein
MSKLLLDLVGRRVCGDLRSWRSRRCAGISTSGECLSVCSRLFVIFKPRLSTPMVFAWSSIKMCCFGSVLASDLCIFARKRRTICGIQKSYLLCFKPLLSFVPTIFVFSRSPAGFPLPDNSSPCQIPHGPAPRPNVRNVKKLELWLDCAHLYNQFEFVLSSFQNSIVCFQ